jgi:hypothetical protein
MIQFEVTDKKQVIVPVRFKRAITGFSELDAPDIDDRGYVMGTRPGTWGKTTLQGPMVGLTVGDEVRLKVLREDIDSTAILFATSTDTTLIEISDPKDGGSIGDDGIFKIKGIKDVANQGVAVQVRLGTATGPIIGEIEPHIFNPFRIPITVHMVQIDDATTTGTVPDQPIQRIIDRMKAIWRPCGVEIEFDSSKTPVVNDRIKLSVADQVKDPDDDKWAEVKKVLGLQRQRLKLGPGNRDRSVNWYIIGDFSDSTTVGLGVRRDLADQLKTDPGIFTTANGVTDDKEIERVARTVAHEIGHFFTLKHVQEQNAKTAVQDTYGLRQLMWPLSFMGKVAATAGLTATPRVADVGYGDKVRGCLITLKNHAGHKTDGECASARKSIATNQWF